jgi:ribosomal silencing factor RsfS
MTATPKALEMIQVAAAAASDKLATDIVAFDVSDQLVITEERSFYALERLWRDCPSIDVRDAVGPIAPPVSSRD